MTRLTFNTFGKNGLQTITSMMVPDDVVQTLREFAIANKDNGNIGAMDISLEFVMDLGRFRLSDIQAL